MLNLEEWRAVFISGILLLGLMVTIPVLGRFIPRGDEPFFVLAVLGEEGMAESYFPDDDPGLEPGEEVSWFLYLYNHMGEAEYVALRLKLLNSTHIAPNSTSRSPAVAPTIYEVRRVLRHNETFVHLFTWGLEEVQMENEFVRIESLMINGDLAEVHVTGEYDSNFRMIIELWVYDRALQEFAFGWSSGEEARCAWNQIWFSATHP